MEAESEESEPEPESIPRRRRDKTHDAEGEVYADDTSDEEEMRREVVHAQQRRNELIAESPSCSQNVACFFMTLRLLTAS